MNFKKLKIIMKKILLFIIHVLFQSRRVDVEVRQFAKSIKSKNILEIGSGRNPRKDYFDSTNKFTMSDISPVSRECRKIDVCKMKINNIYDLIICANVLDDIYDYQKAVGNIYKALTKHGQILLIVNGFYPLHDLPNDYWRFTEYSLEKIFSQFRKVEIKTIGLEYFPSYYILIAEK